MSIFDIFRGNAQQPQQQAAPQNQHIQSNPTVPNQSNTVQQQPTPENPNPQSPTDKFADLWKMESTPNQAAPNFKLNQEQLQKVTGSMDFSKSVSPDDLARVVQGGEDAAVALKNILQTVGRDVFGMAAQFSSHMTESGYKVSQEALDKGLPNMVRKQLTSQELYAANPKLRDPALQPLVGALQSQFADKHPNATPTEINAMVSEYLGGTVASAFAPAPAQQPNQPGQADFSAFLS